MNWKCRIGWHDFRPYAINSVVNPIPVERCQRCGIGRQITFGAGVRYTKEQMDEVKAKTRPSEEVALAQNEIFRDALERIFRGSDTTMGMNPRTVAGIFQGVAERALATANNVGKEVEYWLEPRPGNGTKAKAFKAPSKEWGLRYLRDNKHSDLYQLKPRRVEQR